MALSKYIFVLFSLLFSLQTANADEKYRELIDKYSEVSKKVHNLTPPTADCNVGFLVSSDGTPVTSSDGSKISTGFTIIAKGKLGKIKSVDGREFELSILNLEEATEAFDDMASQKHIPFKFPEDGCYARAHEMSQLLEKKGVITGKMFIEGALRVETKNSPKGYVQWWYHVAPVVLVKVGDELVPYVIDPSIFKKPVPATEWFAIQTAHKEGRIDRTYSTKRFNYTPTNSDSKDEYSASDLEGTKSTMESYMKIQKEREAQNGN